MRLAADDLRTWYLHAAAQQPGRATSPERNTWFWRDTAVAQLLGRVTARLLDDPDPIVRMFADRGLVPRDHFDFLVHPLQPPDPERSTRCLSHERSSASRSAGRPSGAAPTSHRPTTSTTERSEIDEICRVRDDLIAADVSLGAVDPESAPIPADGRDASPTGSTGSRTASVSSSSEGLDIDGWSEREAGLVYYALGRQLGVPVKQNASGSPPRTRPRHRQGHLHRPERTWLPGTNRVAVPHRHLHRPARR